MVAKAEVGGRELNWEFGISRYKLVNIELINTKVLLYSTGNYIQYPVITHNRKEYENECIFIYLESVHNVGDLSSIPGLRRSPGEGNGNPLQYSCLEKSMDRGAWRATVYGVPKSQTQLSD